MADEKQLQSGDPASVNEETPAVDDPTKEAQGKASSGIGSSIKGFLSWTAYIAFLLVTVVGLLALIEYFGYLQIKNSPAGKPYEDTREGMDRARRSSQQISPVFGYEPTPGFAAVRNTKLGNSYEFINEESFKDFEDVPLKKPEDEYRVFVTGGSVVYGRGPVPPTDRIADFYEVTYRWTIPHIMEKLLNADPRVKEKIGGKTVRVINAGVPGYVIQNNLTRYLAKLRMYQPDLVVSLDGANEVHTVARPLADWNYFTQGQYHDIITSVMDMSPTGLQNYIALWLKRNSYFFTWLALRRGEGTGIIDERVGFTSNPMPPTPEMLEFRRRNIQQVADVLAVYHATLETDGVPHVLALQPMFRNCKKQRTPLEKKIEEATGMVKVSFYDAAETYDLIVKTAKERTAEAGSEVLDLTTIFDDVTKWVFTDWCHLTNGANYLLAKALTNRVKTEVLGLTLLPGDPLKEPYDAYFTDYAKNATVNVDGKPVNEGLHILKGYPGEKTLEVKAGPKDAEPSLTMDLKDTVPISRLRVVWADEKAVPASWKLEFSEDGKSWREWLSVKDTSTDDFDQWPGYEYYATEQSPARYVRYSETGEAAKSPIRLRQISLFK